MLCNVTNVRQYLLEHSVRAQTRHESLNQLCEENKQAQDGGVEQPDEPRNQSVAFSWNPPAAPEQKGGQIWCTKNKKKKKIENK